MPTPVSHAAEGRTETNTAVNPKNKPYLGVGPLEQAYEAVALQHEQAVQPGHERAVVAGHQQAAPVAGQEVLQGLHRRQVQVVRGLRAQDAQQCRMGLCH